MKYIRTYEKYNLGEIEDFLKMYEINKKFENDEQLFMWYKIPDVFYYEFTLLLFLYKRTSYWKTGYTKVDKRTKDCVKQYVKDQIVKKFEEDPNNYIELKKTLESKGNINNPSSFAYINNQSIKFTFFALLDALNKAPDWIKKSVNYNL